MSTHALGLTLALDERGLHPATRARAHLVVEVTAVVPGIERARPPLSVVLSVDTSGSMAGPPIEHVIQSIDRILTLLEPTDRIGVVGFSNNAYEVAPLAAADAANRRLVSTRAHRLCADGGTNIEAGLTRAAGMMPPRGVHERQVVLLLSDGAPNVGRASAEDLTALARSFRPNVAVSTLGYGPNHHEDLLQAISDAGAGRHHFIADPKVCEMELAQALGAQGDVVAEDVELTLLLEKGVEIARFLGKPEVRFGAAGLKIGVPDLLEGSRFLVVAEVDVSTPREGGSWGLLRASLGYRRAGERERLSVDAGLTIDVGGAVVGHPYRGAGAPASTVDPVVRAKVLCARADEARAEARALADRRQFEGAAAVLRRMIQAIQAEPWFVTNDGSPLAEAVEQLVDEATAMERRPSQEAYSVFRKATMVNGFTHSAPSSTHCSELAISRVAGVLPRAELVVLNGDLAGQRFPLVRAKAVIGRTPTADVVIRDDKVSRQHAAITGQDGRFSVMDLGSTNTSALNGRILSQPEVLSPGDVLRIGDVELRYEEPGRS